MKEQGRRVEGRPKEKNDEVLTFFAESGFGGNPFQPLHKFTEHLPSNGPFRGETEQAPMQEVNGIRAEDKL